MIINNKRANKLHNEIIRNEEENLFNGIYIPQEYRRRVIKHLILNYCTNINGMQPSLFLAIQGSRGEGKTYMLQTLCKRYNIEMIYVSASDLCGPNEGDSVDKIKRKYETACIEYSKTKKLSVIVIDDFHLSIASDLGENVSKTTNSQVLLGYLMNLADSPYYFNVRIPIILLGNNFKNIYPALIRNGRMDFFSWVPELDEKVKIVYFMFKKFYPEIDFEDVEKIVYKYPDKYVAFYKDVVQDLFFSNFDLVINEFELRGGNVSLNEMNDLIINFLKVDQDIIFEKLEETADARNLIREADFETKKEKNSI